MPSIGRRGRCRQAAGRSHHEGHPDLESCASHSSGSVTRPTGLIIEATEEVGQGGCPIIDEGVCDEVACACAGLITRQTEVSPVTRGQVRSNSVTPSCAIPNDDIGLVCVIRSDRPSWQHGAYGGGIPCARAAQSRLAQGIKVLAVDQCGRRRQGRSADEC